jgi:hypothetical protein
VVDDPVIIKFTKTLLEFEQKRTIQTPKDYHPKPRSRPQTKHHLKLDPIIEIDPLVGLCNDRLSKPLLVRDRLSFIDQSISDESEYPQDTFEELTIQRGQFKTLVMDSVHKSKSLKISNPITRVPIPPESENMRKSFSRQLLVDSGSTITHWNKLSSIVNKAGSLKISNLMKRVQETNLLRDGPKEILSLDNSLPSFLENTGSVSKVSILPLEPETKSKISLWRSRFVLLLIGIRLGNLYNHVKDDYATVMCVNERPDSISLSTQLKEYVDEGDPEFNSKVLYL